MRKKATILILFLLSLSLALAACGGGDAPAQTDGQPPEAAPAAGDPVAGERLFQQSCAACHGMDATGVPGLGKDMTVSEFNQSLSDAELLAFIKEGRPVGHPDNTTGVDMPPKGGNPALTDEQLMDIIAYMRSLER